MKAVLHIGTPKTGTTSCQQWFAENRAALRDQGIVYSLALGAVNHRALMVYARDTDKMDKSFARRSIVTAADHDAFREKLRLDFAAERSKNSDARYWVISNEHLYSKIKTKQMIARVRDFLTPHFDQITVYLHLRPQVDLLNSNASQISRLGQVVSLPVMTRASIGDKNDFYNYDGIVRRWESVFGAQNIHLVPFRRSPNITDYLATEIGIDRRATSGIPHKNAALGWRSMALVNALVHGAADGGAGDLGNLTQALFLDQLPKSEKLQFGLDVAQDIQSRFAKINQQLAARRGDITLEDLTPDWARYAGPANLHRIQEECEFSEPLVYLVTRYRQELQLERARALLAESEIAGTENPAQQQKKIQQAEQALRIPQCLPDLQDRHRHLKTRLQNRKTAHDPQL